MMNAPTPSTPPRGTRVTMPVQAMRLRPLPARDLWTTERLRSLFRRRPLPRRGKG